MSVAYVVYYTDYNRREFLDRVILDELKAREYVDQQNQIEQDKEFRADRDKYAFHTVPLVR